MLIIHNNYNNKLPYVFQRQLELFGAGTPVSWKINLSENIFWWNTRSWNTSQLEKMLDLTPIEKVPIFICKSFLVEVLKLDES